MFGREARYPSEIAEHYRIDKTVEDTVFIEEDSSEEIDLPMEDSTDGSNSDHVEGVGRGSARGRRGSARGRATPSSSKVKFPVHLQFLSPQTLHSAPPWQDPLLLLQPPHQPQHPQTPQSTQTNAGTPPYYKQLMIIEADSYIKAMEKCQRLMDTSSIETEDDASVHKRYCRRPRRFMTDSSSDDKSVPQARKHSRTECVSGSPVCKQMSLPPPPAYESTPHRKPAGRPELDGSIVTQARPEAELITQREVSHHTEGGGSAMETEMRAVRTYITCMAQRMDAFEEKMEQKMDELLMQWQVATNDVLKQYSLRGRKAKKAFQDLTICRQMRGNLTAADVEDLIGQVLKFAPHRRQIEIR
ncbi:unnamed protein product [Leuciscus chuanchicus]